MYSLNGPNCHMKGLRALIIKALFLSSPAKTPRGTKMMEGFQGRVSEPNSSGLSDWIPVAACQPWAVRAYSSHSGGQHRHDLTASTSYSSTCAKPAGYPVLLASKCMLVGFAANNKGPKGHWRAKLEEEDTLLACFARDQQLAPLGALRAGKLAGRLTLGNL
ncbi:hypothetical protein HDV62DRAFT_55602 [Trichoderma sp. SZMC 28011]